MLLCPLTLVNACIPGVAHKNNRMTQRKIAEENAIATLVQLMLSPQSVEIQVEVAYTLGCVVLSNGENQQRLKEEQCFKFDILLDLLSSDDDVSRRLKLAQNFSH